MWTAYVSYAYGEVIQFQPADVAAMMSMLKLARIAKSPEKADSWIDLAGYAACGGECATQEDTVQSAENATSKEDTANNLLSEAEHALDEYCDTSRDCKTCDLHEECKMFFAYRTRFSAEKVLNLVRRTQPIRGCERLMSVNIVLNFIVYVACLHIGFRLGCKHGFSSTMTK